MDRSRSAWSPAVLYSGSNGPEDNDRQQHWQFSDSTTSGPEGTCGRAKLPVDEQVTAIPAH